MISSSDGSWTKSALCASMAASMTRGMSRYSKAPSRNISNFYGLLAWCVGVVVGVTSLYAVRRRSYALFMVAHQLHWAWWFFVCLHWPGILAFAAPSVVFIAADSARRRVAERTARCAVAATGDATMATVLVPMPGYAKEQLTRGVVRIDPGRYFLDRARNAAQFSKGSS